ncbi:hypothetical protein [Nostoc sp.]
MSYQFFPLLHIIGQDKSRWLKVFIPLLYKEFGDSLSCGAIAKSSGWLAL